MEMRLRSPAEWLYRILTRASDSEHLEARAVSVCKVARLEVGAASKQREQQLLQSRCHADDVLSEDSCIAAVGLVF